MHNSRILLGGLLLATALSAPALADPRDIHARVHVGPAGRPHIGIGVHVDRFHRVPPGIRARGLPGRVTVRVNPFRAHLGWRVNRFSPRERVQWTHGRWWHGRLHGRLGWWWWANGGWFFYDAPVYPYPDYVSETYYDVPASDDAGDYWYYCRDPEGYYPYVRNCHVSWEPVPAQPAGGGYDNGGNGPGDQDEMGPDDQGPPNQYGPSNQGPPAGYGPSDQGPPDDYGPPDDQGGPPDDQGGPPDDQGPPDDGPPPQ